MDSIGSKVLIQVIKHNIFRVFVGKNKEFFLIFYNSKKIEIYFFQIWIKKI